MIRNRVNLAFNHSDRLGAKTMGQHEDRRAAAQAFMESLAQLEQTFKPAEFLEELSPETLETPEASKQSPLESAQFSLDSFEDAIADLEQFIQRSQTQETL